MSNPLKTGDHLPDLLDQPLFITDGCIRFDMGDVVVNTDCLRDVHKLSGTCRMFKHQVR